MEFNINVFFSSYGVKPGASRCPCRVGLTCKAVIPTNETEGVTGRCVYIGIDTDEVEEKREFYEIEN